MASREESKTKRRRQIVRAARALMQQTGNTGFSMRALADQARVSIATPYNLFGSKQAIMFAVLDADLEAYQTRLARLRADELEVFFKAVSLATTLYSTEPGFYKAVLLAVYNEGGREYRAMFGGSRHAMWKGLVQAAIDAKVLADDVEPDVFAINLARIFFASILEWVHGELSLPELEAWVHYGWAQSLLAMSTPESAPRLRVKMVQGQKRIQQLWKKRIAAVRAAAATADYQNEPN
jgi:AcrR family transcriptional regulator